MIDYINWVMFVWHVNLDVLIIVLLVSTVFVNSVTQDTNWINLEMTANLFVVISLLSQTKNVMMEI